LREKPHRQPHERKFLLGTRRSAEDFAPPAASDFGARAIAAVRGAHKTVARRSRIAAARLCMNAL
jgi:hypothetical protein